MHFKYSLQKLLKILCLKNLKNAHQLLLRYIFIFTTKYAEEAFLKSKSSKKKRSKEKGRNHL